MSRPDRPLLMWVAVVAVSLCVAAALAELADVYLKSGAKLRGDVTVTDTEVVVRNKLGEARFPLDQVERVVSLEEAPPATTTQSAPPPVSTQPAGNEREQGAPAPEAAEVERRPPAAPPPLSALDIQRLKLSELRMDGPAERLTVRFAGDDQRELPREVLQELVQRPDYQAEWEETLLRGSRPEKLQLIARTTGTQYADRLSISDDPEVFAEFRRRVLPTLVKGCGKAGCHAGDDAAVFRFPAGSPRGEEYAYTTFALLDRMATESGPLIDRDYPEGSVLLSYMLPEKDSFLVHPPVEGKRRFTPVLRGRDNQLYERIRDWINSLRTPHPEYGLDYVFPAEWLAKKDVPAEPQPEQQP